MNSKIPKKIHFIWFGEELPWHIQYYIALNKQMYKGYKIKVWGIKDFDPNTQAYTKRALELKKYAFISDYLRTRILYDEGGIYLDTDMIPIRNVKDLLKNKIVLGFEYRKMVTTGFVAAEPKQPFFKRVLDIYESYNHLDKDFKFIINNELWTIILKDIYGLKLTNSEQLLPADIKVYNSDYFSQMSLRNDSYYLHDHKLSWTTPTKAKIMHGFLKVIRESGRTLEIFLVITEKIYYIKNKRRIRNLDKAMSSKTNNDKPKIDER